ncbi:hypothetical protein [Candidatus Nitrosotalea okcheonensis]|uniref:Uncharacterized protein n=1 Tax=Candidatus Nitrosotalea okcheonensis TaxID=1903276 RepID=A0A2H1FC55_9ARCH|nr:hypothetical protein [Candidatus Nitrosotalea okcheonensis]SMH70345.1 exported protein of unknown function [Candidatus Nitrosotalea okcheonensis]
MSKESKEGKDREDKFMAKTVVIVGGAAILSFGVFLLLIPVSSIGTATDTHEACNSVIGTLGKVFSSEISQRCQQVEDMAFGSYALIGIGTLLVIVGAIYKKIKS